MSSGRPYVIGLGSPHGDDQAGWLVVEALRLRGWNASEARNVAQPVDVLDTLPVDRPLLVCDAANGESVGAFRTWSWPTMELPTLKPSGSHNMPLASVLELARQLRLLNGSVVVKTIDGKNWTSFSKASEAVELAARKLADEIDGGYPNA